MPGADVSIGLNSPRYSAGAFGLRSQVSMCDAPPLSQIRMVDLACLRALAAGLLAAGARRGKCRPQKPTPPATRKVRRLRAARMISCWGCTIDPPEPHAVPRFLT